MLRFFKPSLSTFTTRPRPLAAILHRLSHSEKDEVDFIKDELPVEFLQKLPFPKFGGISMVSLLTGDSMLGKKGAKYIAAIFATLHAPIEFESISVGQSREFIYSVMRNRNALYIDLRFDPEEKRRAALLNTRLDLFAAVIKLHSIYGYNCRYDDLDITLLVQNVTSDVNKLEYEPVPGVVKSLKVTEYCRIKRYLEFAYEYAKKNCRKKITFAHRVNEIPLADGMFLEIACELGEQHPDIEMELMMVNEMTRQLIMAPQRFDLICASDQYGTFLASVASAVCGGPSLFSCIDMGRKHAVFQPLQTKLSITNISELSPYGIVRACVDMLSHLRQPRCAHLMWQQLVETMIDDEIKTKEFGGCHSGEYVICHIVDRLKDKFRNCRV